MSSLPLPPFEAMPTLGVLLSELDASPKLKVVLVREAIYDVLAYLYKWKILHLLIILLFFGYVSYVYFYFPHFWKRSSVLFGITLYAVDLMVMSICSLGVAYFNSSKEHVEQIENEMYRESQLINRLKHLPHDSLLQMKRRVTMEVDFNDKAKFTGTGIAVFAFISGMGAHAYQLGTTEWWAQSANVILISAAACLLYFTGVMTRLSRKYMRLAYVLECADAHYIK
jgi:small-conductance mechanosensitive channel